MKKPGKNIEQEIERILQSASSAQRVNTSPFFTTRVMGKVEQLEDIPAWLPQLQMLLRPVLVLLLIVNIVNFYIYSSAPDSIEDSYDPIELAVNDYAAWDNDFIFSEDLVKDKKNNKVKQHVNE